MKNFIALLFVPLMIPLTHAQQWPTFRYDDARSGHTSEAIDATRLELAWQWQSELPPDPAWDGPARWDAYAQIRDLPAMRQYDACFHPISDGESIFFGSSSQDTLTAINLIDGKKRWSFVAGGPIRLAPRLDGDRILFGCDDGNAYCLDRAKGTLIWKFSPSLNAAASQRPLINNDRLISNYPIRTGITVRDGIAYFGASFLPWLESYICAVDVETGELSDSKNTFIQRHEDATLEGNLLVTEDRLIVPQGRVAPLLFDRKTGKGLGSLPGGGGVTIVLTEEGDVVRTEGGRDARSGQVGVFKGKERVASFPRGRSIVVAGDTFFVIDGQKLLAAGRDTNELKWTRDVNEPLELIMADSTLFIGGRDHVTAVNSEDGKVLWSAKANGRVFGLAVAGKRLIASTDAGAIHVFAATGTPQSASADTNKKRDTLRESPPVSPVREKNLLHRWVFHRSAMKTPDQTEIDSTSVQGIYVEDQTSDVDLKLSGAAEIIQVNEDSNKIEAVKLSGGFFPLDDQASELPTTSITVEAWVRVDETQEWGSFAGCFQDDGDAEHGWLLGYRSNRFFFGMAAGGSGLSYATANEEFKPKSWNHVVGTYNGREMRLYVNGSLADSSTAESGPISYADKRFFTVGAYRDSNELYPMIGALHEIRMYSTPLDATTVARLYQSLANEFPEPQDDGLVAADDFVTWGPFTRFIQSGEIEISYGTDQKCASVVDLITETGVRRVVLEKPATEHTVTLTDLPYRREIQFQIRDRDTEDAKQTDSYALDTHFDWTAPQPTAPSSSISQLVAASPNPRGLAFVVGIENVAQAEQLANESEFNVVLVVDDELDAAKIRQQWNSDEKIVYGSHLSVCAKSIREMPAASAALVISNQSNEELRRLVRPEGGVLSDGNSVVWKRKPVEGAGVWSHMYGTADNSAFGGESLSNASNREDLSTQWIGRPGPRYKTDRQNRKPSPLAAGGRLFLQGQQRMIALDSYSGTVLWSVESPTVMRWNVPHDCSNWCADEDGIYVAAKNQAWFIDGKTGQLERRIDIPESGNHAAGKSWGYIGRYKNQLLGTTVDSEAIYTDWWGGSQWFDSVGGDDTHVTAGEQLFSVDLETGDIQWKHDGLVLHPTITVMDDGVYFVEDRTVAHQESSVRRISLDQDQTHELVCLDVATGQQKWSRPIEPFTGHISSLYLAGGGEGTNRCLVMVASEATQKEFSVQSFESQTGEPKWARTVAWEATHHGKHISRPAMQGELMYLRPEVLSLADGSTIHRGFPDGHGCSSYTLTTHGMFSRLGETTWWDVRTQKVNRFKRIRTDCWISVVPAAGMVLSAEGGGGCSCGTWLETSLGFLPRSLAEERPE